MGTANRQKIRSTITELFEALGEEVDEGLERAAVEVRKTIDDIKANPHVKEGGKRVRKAAAAFGTLLVEKFGTRDQARAVRKQRKASPPPSA